MVECALAASGARVLVLEARRVQRGEGGLSVLLRQGMIPWMQLCAAERRVESSHGARAAPIPAPVRSELLVTLTGLVFGASCRRS